MAEIKFYEDILPFRCDNPKELDMDDKGDEKGITYFIVSTY